MSKPNLRLSVILVAAGAGRRMGLTSLAVRGRRRLVRKPFLEIDGKPMFLRALRQFRGVASVDEIVLVLHRLDIVWVKRAYAGELKRAGVKKIIPGGKRRQDSVWNGLRAVDPGCGLVAIHDAARPFVRPADIENVIRAAEKRGAAILAVPARDTLKEVDAARRVVRTPERRRLWHAQTPQVFQRTIIMGAYRRAREEGVEATDDAQIVERQGVDVVVVKGAEGNIKITTREDLRCADFPAPGTGDNYRHLRFFS